MKTKNEAKPEAAKHTPGPWRTGVIKSGWDIYSPDTATPTIAIVPDWEHSQANARLIAAAPDLLEAAKAVLQVVSACGDDDLAWNLRDAIAKAEAR